MIDLHGHTVQQTKKILENHFKKIIENNISEFYIITGRGNHAAPDGNRGVLKKALPKLFKPYEEHILTRSEEGGSFKITLKQHALHESELAEQLKQMLALVSNSNHENSNSGYLQDLEQKAKNQDIRALILLAIFHTSGNIKGYNDKDRAIQLLQQAKELDSLETKKPFTGQTELLSMVMSVLYLT